MNVHRVLPGIFVGLCLLLFGSTVLAGRLDCQFLADPACDQSAQQYVGYEVKKVQFGSLLANYRARSALANGLPQLQQLNWGHALNHARVLQLFLFDGSHWASELANDGAYGVKNGNDAVAGIDEPGTIALICLGLAAIGVHHLRRKRHQPR